MSAFDDMPYLKATGDSFVSMKHDVGTLKCFLEVEVQFVPVQGVVTFEVVLINNEETTDDIDYCVYPLVSSSSSRPFFLFL